MERLSQDIQRGDIYTDGEGSHFLVKDVSITAQQVDVLLAAGRTDKGEWYTFPVGASLSLYRDGDATGQDAGTEKPPRSVLAAIAAFEEAEKAELFYDRKRAKSRLAILSMATDEAAADWQSYYATETDKILRAYAQRRKKENL